MNELCFNMAAAFLSLSCLFYTVLKGRTKSPRNRCFILIISDIAFTSICATIGHYAEALAEFDQNARTVMYTSAYLYFLTHTALGFIFYNYSVFLCDAEAEKPNWKTNVLYMPAIITEFLILLNPLLHLIYSYDDRYRIVQGTQEWTLYAMALFYAIHCGGMLIRHRKALDTDRKTAILFFYILTTMGMIIQYATQHIRVELFFESLAVLGLMLTIEDDDHLRERVTSVYNRNALVLELFSLFARQKRFKAFCLRLKDPASIQRILGTDAVETIPVVVAAFLKTIHPMYYIYRSSSSSFVLLIPEGDRHCRDDVEKLILKRFEKSFDIDGAQVELTYHLLEASAPEELSNAADILRMADIPLQASNESLVLKGEDMKFFFRSAKIEEALHRSLIEESFGLEFIPIMSASDNTLWSEEARLYIEDEELGRISQEEFLPVAQELTLVSDIAATLLRYALKKFGQGETSAKRINVDLYTALWKRDDFIRMIKSVISEYGVNTSRVSLEISESDIRGDLEGLTEMTKALKEMGFMLTLDRYGAGYADIRTVFSLNFDQVKLDRSLMENAVENYVGDAVLEENVDMIRRMGHVVIADGTDSTRQLELARKLKIDYVLGQSTAAKAAEDGGAA